LVWGRKTSPRQDQAQINDTDDNINGLSSPFTDSRDGLTRAFIVPVGRRDSSETMALTMPMATGERFSCILFVNTISYRVDPNLIRFQAMEMGGDQHR
jgi:hypothetical protein